MPVVTVDPDELRSLTGHEDNTVEDFVEDLFALGLELEAETDDGELELEFGPDRLDRLSVEGIARSLRYHYGDDRGVALPTASDPQWTIEVDESVPETRPYITGVVIRDVEMDESALESLIQLQEKLHATMGRDRAKGAIGVHDVSMLQAAVTKSPEYEPAEADDEEPLDRTLGGRDHRGQGSIETDKVIRYTGVDPTGPSFVPLESDEAMTPETVCRDHPTGQTYGDLVTDGDRYPAIFDDLGLFSFPPVINSRRTEVTTDTRDLFIECTGTDQWTIDRMAVILCYALAARGGSIESVTVSYPDAEPLERPTLETAEKRLGHERIETILGIDLDRDMVLDLLERSGLEGTVTEVGDDEIAYDVTIPPYRVDVLHPRDIIDDIGRAYGFNDLEVRYPDVSTVGGRHERSRQERAVRDTLVGLGFEDLLNFNLINEAETFHRMGLPMPADGPAQLERDPPPTVEPALSDRVEAAPTDAFGLEIPVTIEEPYSEAYTIVRTWALPSLMMVLENNTHRAYPQRLIDIGLTAAVDESAPTKTREQRTIAAVIAREGAGFEAARSALQGLAGAHGVELETPETTHPSFIDGRAATVMLDGEEAGIIGELHPAVLIEHDLEVPVAAFECRLDGFFD